MEKAEESESDFDAQKFLRKHVGDAGVDKAVKYDTAEIKLLCQKAAAVLREEASLLELQPPVVIAGNLNGQYRDMLAALCAGGFPPGVASNWLFLGDYISRGSRSLECLCFLLAAKLLYPTHIFLLRGHHEDKDVASQFGFKGEAERRLGAANAWEYFVPVFEALPLAATIGNPPTRIFAVHGGISPGMTLAQVAGVVRPCTMPRYGLVTDLVWADVDPLTVSYGDSERGISHKFGKKAIATFCAANDVALIVRSHQLVQEGFQFFGSQLLTLWTATGYNSEFSNCGAILDVGAGMTLQLKVMLMEVADEEGDDHMAQSHRETSQHLPVADLVQQNLCLEEEAREAAKVQEPVPKGSDAPVETIFGTSSLNQLRAFGSRGKKGSGGKGGSAGKGSKKGSDGKKGSGGPVKGSAGSKVKKGSNSKGSDPVSKHNESGTNRLASPVHPNTSK